jgi:ubiquinone biosynthesis protein
VRQDPESITDALETLGVLPFAAARASLRRDVDRLLQSYYGLPAADVDVQQLIVDLMAIVRSNRLQLPTELALVLKTLAMAEGLARRLDPEFNSSSVAEEYVEKAVSGMYSPVEFGKRTVQAGADLLDLGAVLPGQLRRIAMRLDRGDFEVTLRHRDIDEALNRASSMVTRLSTAVVTAAFIIGLPVLTTVYEPPGWSVMAPFWFFGGLAIVVALIVRLVIAGRGRTRH